MKTMKLILVLGLNWGVHLNKISTFILSHHDDVNDKFNVSFSMNHAEHDQQAGKDTQCTPQAIRQISERSTTSWSIQETRWDGKGTDEKTCCSGARWHNILEGGWHHKPEHCCGEWGLGVKASRGRYNAKLRSLNYTVADVPDSEDMDIYIHAAYELLYHAFRRCCKSVG